MAPRWSESYKPRYELGLVKMETASKVEERGNTRLKLTGAESSNQPPSPRSTEEKWVETKAARGYYARAMMAMEAASSGERTGVANSSGGLTA